MRRNTATLGVVMSLGFVASVGVAAADPWVLLIPPAPYTQNLPAYSSWQEHRVYATRSDCLSAPMTLHYEYWKTDQDLSMRALNGICRDQATGELAGLPDDDDW